jgi:hypothetical protein
MRCERVKLYHVARAVYARKAKARILNAWIGYFTGVSRDKVTAVANSPSCFRLTDLEIPTPLFFSLVSIFFFPPPLRFRHLSSLPRVREQDRLGAQELLKKTAEEIVKRYDGRITMVREQSLSCKQKQNA